ncbi:MAG: DUF1579 domain-containing protein [Planctomycetota bacterium]
MPETDMEACVQAAAPGDAHRRLDAFAGTWKAKVKHWMEPGADPNESTGVMTNRWELGHRFLRQDYRDDSGMYEGSGYWGYNNITGRYEGMWVDTMSTNLQTETGNCDEAGKVWEMTGESEFPAAGQKMTRRSVITLHGPDRHAMEMYFSGPDGAEFKVMEIEYTR